MSVKGAVFNQLVYSADTYIIMMSVNRIPYPLWLVEDFKHTAKRGLKTIYPMGSPEPVGFVPTESGYSGQISMEAGILETILLINKYVSPTQIDDATISISTYAGLMAKVFSGVYIKDYDFNIKAKAKRSLVTLNFEALELKLPIG